jgi:hypothetical protein
VELRSGRDASVERSVQALGAYLTAEIDGEGWVTETMRSWPAVTAWSQTWSSGCRLTRGSLSRRSWSRRVPIAPTRRDRAGDHTSLHQLRDRLGDDVGVDRQVAPVAQVMKHLVRDPSEADLQRGLVVDEPDR